MEFPWIGADPMDCLPTYLTEILHLRFDAQSLDLAPNELLAVPDQASHVFLEDDDA